MAELNLTYSLKILVYLEAENLLADNIEEESDFEDHRDLHGQLEPSVPPGYPEAAVAVEDSPPPAVPPVADGGKHLHGKRSIHGSWLNHTWQKQHAGSPHTKFWMPSCFG